MDKALRAWLGMTAYENALNRLQELTGKSQIWAGRVLVEADFAELSYDGLIFYLENGGSIPEPRSIGDAYRAVKRYDEMKAKNRAS